MCAERSLSPPRRGSGGDTSPMSTPQPPGTKSEVKRVFVRHESIPEGDLLCPCAPAGVTTVAELKAEAGRRLANVLGVSLSVREVLLRGISLDDRRGLSTVLRDGSTVEVVISVEGGAGGEGGGGPKKKLLAAAARRGSDAGSARGGKPVAPFCSLEHPALLDGMMMHIPLSGLAKVGELVDYANDNIGVHEAPDSDSSNQSEQECVGLTLLKASGDALPLPLEDAWSKHFEKYGAVVRAAMGPATGRAYGDTTKPPLSPETRKRMRRDSSVFRRVDSLRRSFLVSSMTPLAAYAKDQNFAAALERVEQDSKQSSALSSPRSLGSDSPNSGLAARGRQLMDAGRGLLGISPKPRRSVERRLSTAAMLALASPSSSPSMSGRPSSSPSMSGRPPSRFSLDSAGANGNSHAPSIAASMPNGHAPQGGAAQAQGGRAAIAATACSSFVVGAMVGVLPLCALFLVSETMREAILDTIINVLLGAKGLSEGTA